MGITQPYTCVLLLIGCLSCPPARAAQISVDAKSVEQWIEKLSDEDPNVRHAAAFALGLLRSQSKAAVPILREWLQSDRADVRLSALETLGRIGPAAREAVPELIKLQKDRKLARWAQLALFHVAPDADPTIAETITLDDLWIGDDAESSVEVLGYALRHCQVTVRRYAADKLVEFGPAAEPATEQLTAATLDSDSRVRKSAARALMRLHVELDKTLPMLIGNLSNGNATTRQLAVFALGEIGGPAKSAMPQLTALLEHYDVGTREEAARSIAKIKTALAEHGESKADCP